jgi:hypothetical protein
MQTHNFKEVTQDHEWGCGIACVASRLGISYELAKSRLEKMKGKGINDFPEGLDLDPIVHVLKKSKVKVIADWFAKSFPTGTIALISGKNNPYKHGHYLLKVDKGWMDPWINIDRPKEKRDSGIRPFLPKGTKIKVALIPAEA